MEINYPKEGDVLPFSCFDNGKYRCGYKANGEFYLYEKTNEQWLSLGEQSERLIRFLFTLRQAIPWEAVIPKKPPKEGD